MVYRVGTNGIQSWDYRHNIAIADGNQNGLRILLL